MGMHNYNGVYGNPEMALYNYNDICGNPETALHSYNGIYGNPETALHDCNGTTGFPEAKMQYTFPLTQNPKTEAHAYKSFIAAKKSALRRVEISIREPSDIITESSPLSKRTM